MGVEDIYMCGKTYSEKEITKLADLSVKTNNHSNFTYICANQKLSEEFIEKYIDHVDWYFTSYCQKLTLEFVYKHKERICWSIIKNNITKCFPFNGKTDFFAFWERKRKFDDNFIIENMELIKSNKELLDHLIKKNLLSDRMEEYLLV
jgi:hypothetical protein